MTDLKDLGDEALNRMLAELRGIEPRKLWRFFYDAERQHGAIAITSKEEAERAREKNVAFYESLGVPTVASEPEEYDDWSHAPRYSQSLDECARVEAGLQCLESDYFDNLRAVTKGTGMPVYRASARQRTIALIHTLNSSLKGAKG